MFKGCFIQLLRSPVTCKYNYVNKYLRIFSLKTHGNMFRTVSYLYSVLNLNGHLFFSKGDPAFVLIGLLGHMQMGWTGLFVS